MELWSYGDQLLAAEGQSNSLKLFYRHFARACWRLKKYRQALPDKLAPALSLSAPFEPKLSNSKCLIEPRAESGLGVQGEGLFRCPASWRLPLPCSLLLSTQHEHNSGVSFCRHAPTTKLRNLSPALLLLLQPTGLLAPWPPPV